MAKHLYQAAAGHFYTVTSQGSFITLQIHPSGVAYLQSSGIGINDEIPPQLFQVLQDNRWIATTGTGVQGDLVEIAPLEGKNLRIVLAEQPEGWTLYLVLPPMDPATAQRLPWTSGLEVEGEQRSAARLLQGWLAEITPSTEHYSPKMVGDWGREDSSLWTCGSQGLDPSLSVFALRQGQWRRQLAGSSLLWGETILVVHRDSLDPALDKGLQTHEEIGCIEDWKIATCMLPNRGMPVEWLLKRGIRFVASLPSIACISARQRIAADGAPVFHIDQDIILHVHRAGSIELMTAWLQWNGHEIWSHQIGFTVARFVRFRKLAPGRYVFGIGDQRYRRMEFDVEEHRGAYSPIPMLTVQIGTDQFAGIGNGPPPQVILREGIPPPPVSIDSPGALRWKWRTAKHAGRWESLDLEYASFAFEMRLQRLIDDAVLPAEVVIDAGAYGMVELRFHRAAAPPRTGNRAEELAGITGMDRMRLRWLAATVLTTPVAVPPMMRVEAQMLLNGEAREVALMVESLSLEYNPFMRVGSRYGRSRSQKG